jgi:hypothetical protein
MFEALEVRRLLAVQVSVTGGLLVINGDKKPNLINVIENGGAVHVETSTLPKGAITQQDFTGITAIQINGGGDNDVIFYDGNSVGADIHGDNAAKNAAAGNFSNRQGGSTGGTGNSGGGAKGNDQITVTDEGTGSSTINGDKGADVITVIRGNNTQVFGGDGKDQILLQTSGDDTGTAQAFGEKGDDVFTVYAGTNTIDGGAGKNEVIELGGTNTIINATLV